MASKHRFTTCVSFGADGSPSYCEMDVTVEFSFHPAVAARGPSYASGGEPPEPALVEDVTLLLVNGQPRPWNCNVSDKELAETVEEMVADTCEAAMIEVAYADLADARERAAEARREED